jgi:hypothetical protein
LYGMVLKLPFAGGAFISGAFRLVMVLTAAASKTVTPAAPVLPAAGRRWGVRLGPAPLALCSGPV